MIRLLTAALSLALLAGPPPVQAGGDVTRGAEVYDRCLACHALAYDRVGPRHCGLLGRPAGAIAGFEYSDALGGSGLIWDPGTLDRFLESPTAAVPGTTMTYDGVKDPAERADLIAFLAAAGSSPDCR